MRHEEYKEWLALEATGALAGGDERRALEAHLAECDECRAELDELRDAAAALAYTVAPVAPPAHLRARVLEQVRALGPASDTSSATLKDEDRRAAAAKDAAKDDESARVPPLPSRESRGGAAQFGLWQLLTARPSFAFGAAAAVLLVAALGVTTAVLWSRTRELSERVARLSDDANRARRESERAAERTARAEEMNELLASPEGRVAVLAGTKVAPQAGARIAYDRATGRAMLVAYNLPPAPAGKAYQLWFIAGGKPLPGGLFRTDAAGRARMMERVPAEAGDAPTFAVTLEEERGVPAPKGDMYLLSSAS